MATDSEHLAATRLLAWAIAGRPLEVLPAGVGQGSGSDGHTIWVAPGDDPTDVVVVQAALARVGSLDPALLRRLVARPQLAHRYLAIEAPRALAEVRGEVAGASMIQHASADSSGSAAASFDEARRNRRMATRPDLFGVVRTRTTTSQQTAHSRRDADLAPRPSPDLDPGDDPGDTEDHDRPQRGLGDSIPMPDVVRRLLRRSLRRQRSTPGDLEEQASGHAGPATSGALTAAPSRILGVEPHRDASGGWRHSEWDQRRRVLIPAHCTVNVYQAAVEGPPRPVHLDPRARRALGRAGLIRATQHRQPAGNDIDIDAVVAAVIDRHSHGNASQDLFIGELPIRRGLAALTLVDVSGSSSEHDDSRQVHDLQVDLAASILHGLHRNGARTAAYGFRSYGRNAVQLSELKSFGDRSTIPGLERLRCSKPAGFTRTGAAVRHAAHILDTNGLAPRLLLVVISDGHVYDTGYEDDHGIADCAHALVEARQAGIATACLSATRRRGAPTPPAFVGSTNAVGTVESLVPVLGHLFARALADVDLRRRPQAFRSARLTPGEE